MTFYEADDPSCSPIVVDSGEKPTWTSWRAWSHWPELTADNGAGCLAAPSGRPGDCAVRLSHPSSPAPGSCPFQSRPILRRTQVSPLSANCEHRLLVAGLSPRGAQPGCCSHHFSRDHQAQLRGIQAMNDGGAQPRRTPPPPITLQPFSHSSTVTTPRSRLHRSPGTDCGDDRTTVHRPSRLRVIIAPYASFVPQPLEPSQSVSCLLHLGLKLGIGARELSMNKA